MPLKPTPPNQVPPARRAAPRRRVLCWRVPLLAMLVASLLVACQPAALPAGSPPGTPLVASPSPTPDDGLTTDQRRTLASLQRIDDHPLYTLEYHGAYDPPHVWPAGEAPGTAWQPGSTQERLPEWGCALFAALGDPQRPVFGRNFDWRFSPALLLFTRPPQGYAAAVMVDLEYSGFTPQELAHLEALPLPERALLLDTPRMAFDGMNSAGLVVGMAAVPPGNLAPDPARPTVGSLGIMRLMLDQAADVPQALEILLSYNLEFGGGPPLHYLLADRQGQSLLVEFYQGEIRLFYNDQPWQQATNFLLSAAGDDPAGRCWRYDRLNAGLSTAGGLLDAAHALDLLGQVAQDNTQWSVAYLPAQGEIHLRLGPAEQAGEAKQTSTHTFQLESAP